MAFASLLSAWRSRRTQSSQVAEADAAAAPSTFPIEAYNAALDRLVKIAVEGGAREEQARLTAIAKLPQAARFPRLALNLALSGVVGVEQALDAFGAAESDARAGSQPTEPAAPVIDGKAAPTFH